MEHRIWIVHSYREGLRPQLAAVAPLPNSKRSIAQLAVLPPSCELGESPSSRLMVSVYQAHA